MDEAFASLDFSKIVDDVVLFDSDPQQHVQYVRQISHRCEENRAQFSQEKAHFAGFTLTSLGYSINTDVTNAIA